MGRLHIVCCAVLLAAGSCTPSPPPGRPLPPPVAQPKQGSPELAFATLEGALK